MLRNYIKVAWRNLWKNKIISLINIIGLAFSISFCLLLFFFIRREQSYDSFHKKKDRLFRLEMTDVWASERPQSKKNLFSFFTKNDDVENAVTFPLLIGTDLENNFPEIKSITRFKDEGQHFGLPLIKADNSVYKQPDVFYADKNFFANFSFRLIKGNSKTILSSPRNVVLTETTARKYFGNHDPIGKTIEFVNDSNRLFTVTGIVGDAPSNSSIQYAMILPLDADSRYRQNILERFNHSEHLFIIELADGVSYKLFEQKMDRWANTHFADFIKSFSPLNPSNFHWYLRPFMDCHYNKAFEWGHYTDAKNIYELSCLVIVILAIASLNYVLLTISNAVARSKEIGVRKVMGANRKSIILQFWIETQIVVAIAVLLGLILARTFLPLFNKIIGSELDFSHFSWKEIVPAIFCLYVALGLLAGYYPALFLSKFKPASIIKNFQTFKINPHLSRILVVLQYTACVVFMLAAFIINLQMRYINNKDLGFDKEQVLMVQNPTYDPPFTKHLKESLYLFARTQPSIIQFSAMAGGLDGSGNTNGFKLNGEQKFRKQLAVDFDYFDLLGIKFIKGRPFLRTMTSDTSRKIRPAVVNESLFNLLGKTARLGEFNEDLGETIIGVVPDYHFESLSKKIEPEDHVLAGDFLRYFMFKIKAGQMPATLAKIEKEWKKLSGNYPFEFTFLDQTISKMYEPQMRWQKTVQASCFFAIIIACLGLFGLSAINVSNRTKEIGIRKVLGATVQDIVGSLSKNFISMVAIAIFIGTPLAFWMMNHWLEDFAYRIHLDWWIFVLVGTTALLIAFLTVSLQAFKAAAANPVNSLRAE